MMNDKKDVQLNIRIDPAFLAEITAAAEKEKCTRTEFVRRACRERLDRNNGGEFRQVAGFLQSLYGKEKRSYEVSEENSAASYLKKDNAAYGPEDVLREIENLLKYLEKEGRISRK